MKPDWSHLERFRKTDGPMGSRPGDKFGAFFLPRAGTMIVVIATSGNDEIPWEHVSGRVDTHKGQRCPTWAEMCWIKDWFWEAEECVIQFHPAASEYVNMHPYVLHLWKPLNAVIPIPPKEAVGV